MNDVETARYLGTERETLRRALLALKVPPKGHAYRRTRGPTGGEERVQLVRASHVCGPAFVIKDPENVRPVYRVIDVSGLEVASFRKLGLAESCAGEWGCVADELFRRAAGGDEKAAAALAAVARKHVERARG